MGKKLPQKKLLAEIEVELGKLRSLIEDLRPRQMTSLPVTESGWSVKDIFGHLVGWHQLQKKWHSLELAGEDVIMPDEEFSWKDIRKLNEQIYKKFQKIALKKVMAEFELGHQWIIELIENSSNKELTQLGQFQYTGKSWTLSDYLRANTASHYRWATKHIRKWKKTL